MRVMAFITLLCMGYELSRPVSTNKAEKGLLLAATSDEPGFQEYERGGMQPWQKKASEKAIERYAATQEKKWRRWNEAMFERMS
ncbi:hypothetical protein [Dehalococcoides mccartyi]|uniref:hypothetical protein n=1 Tax=Dehalococcoides mccartyi TaxID=61435 RepID=UPI0011DC806E